MRATIQKWGNSLALRIPKPLAEQAHISQGSLVEIKIVDDVLQIELIAPQHYTLKGLLAEITQDNIHEEVDTGQAQGKEVW
jgi:antitoxin MazE